MNYPYVVSADIKILLEGWAAERGFTLPDEEFFMALRNRFSCVMKGIFPVFELVSEKELTVGLSDLVAETGLVPVSLDRVYFGGGHQIDITRLVDSSGKDCGLGNRPGTSPLTSQFEGLRQFGLKEVVLVDDVIFSGGLIRKIVDWLVGVGIKVPVVCAGVGIGEGIRSTQEYGCSVRCVREYEQVVDEICERDFYPGVPFSGRQLVGNRNIGRPYILPFGDPVGWASVPEGQKQRLSRFCIKQTVQLFEEIERCSGKIVRCSDLGRLIFGLPTDRTRFVSSLRAI